MNYFPVISGKKLIKILERNDFVIIRTKGSHVRMKSNDGRITTIPVHGNKDLPKGLLRKIIFKDLELSTDEVEDFFE